MLGVFFTGVKLSNSTGGLCATPIKSVPDAVCCPSSAMAMPVPGSHFSGSVERISLCLRPANPA